MTNNAALISAIAAWIGVSVYAYLGARLYLRKVSPQTQLPAAQFALFWLGLAAVSAVGALESSIAVFQVPTLTLVVTLLYLEILILCAALWGLVGYLVFLYTGKTSLIPLTGLYGALYVGLLYFITSAEPTAVTVVMGSVGVTITATVGLPILAVLYVFLYAPEFIGSIALFSLFFRSRDPTVRYRVTLVSWSLIAWFGVGTLNVGALLGGGLAAQVLGRSLGLVAAVGVLLAYYPPRAIRTRLGVSSLDEPSPTGSP